MIIVVVSMRLPRSTKAAHANGTAFRQEAVRLGYVTAEEFDDLVQPDAMVLPS